MATAATVHPRSKSTTSTNSPAVSAAWACGAWPASRLLATLKTALKDKAAAVRLDATRSLGRHGSDAVHTDPDYSAAYVILRTDREDGLEGHGLTFTIGRGNELCVAAIQALEGPQECVAEIRETYRIRRDLLCDGLDAAGWGVERPKATMFVWAEIPEPFRHLGSLEFSKLLLAQAKVAASPGSAGAAAAAATAFLPALRLIIDALKCIIAIMDFPFLFS